MAHRVDALEDRGGRLGAEDHYRDPGVGFLGSESATACDLQIADGEDLRRGAHDLDAGDRASVVAHGIATGLALHADARRNRELAADGIHVGVLNARSPLSGAPLLGVGVDADALPATQGHRVHAEDLGGEVLPDILVHPLHDRHHHDEEHHAQDHTQDAEEALHLLRPDLLERQGDPFPELHVRSPLYNVMS
jgi:hypothetical protein